MAGHFTLRTKILRGLHQANTEELLPEAIDRNPSGERIAGDRQTTRPNPSARRLRPLFFEGR